MTHAQVSPGIPATKPWAWLVRVLAIAAAYLITGKLGAYLAIPPGYATAIWPPSGIALAGVLLWGGRIWPGVLLGSFLINFPTTLEAAPGRISAAVLIALSISAGASLQAGLGGYLLRRWGAFPNALDTEKQVFCFLVLGGLASALVNATVSVSTLMAAGRIAPANFLSNWSTWWLGDILGIWIFTPLILAWANRPGEAWQGRRLAITVPITGLFLLTAATVFYESRTNNQRLRAEFDQQALALRDSLEKSFCNHLNVLRSLGGFYLSSKQVDRVGFHKFVNYSLGGFKGIQAIEWSPIVPDAEREAFESAVRREGFPDFRVTEIIAGDQPVPAANRPEYAPVTYLDPYRNNETAFGYDLYSHPVRREAMLRARDSGELSITAPITLVQETGGQAGLLAFIPLYKPLAIPSNIEERRAALTGYVLAVFRGGDIVAAALENIDRQGLILSLIDEQAPAGEQSIFSSGSEPMAPPPEKGLFGGNFSLGASTVLALGGRQWRFEVAPTQEYFALHRSDNAWLIQSAGLLLTSLAGSFVLIASGRGNRLKQLVEERTAALKLSEERFRTTFEAAPIGVTNSSPTGRFLEVNQGYCEFLGYSREELLEMTYRQVTAPEHWAEDDALIAKTLAGEIAGFSREKQYIRKNGETVWGNLSLKLVRDAKGKPDHFIAVVENIEARKAAEASLSKLLLAVEQSPSSVLIANLEATIEYVNQAFVDITGYSREEAIGQNPRLLHSGLTPHEVFDEMWATLGRGEVWKGELINRKKDGGLYTEAAVISPVRQPDGKISHYVGIKEDITERKAAESRLRESEKRFRAVADATPVLIWMSNADCQCIWFNKVWLDFTGRGMAQELGDGWSEGVHPYDREKCLAICHDSFQRREPFQMEYRLRHRGGEYRWIADHGVPRFGDNGSFEGFIGSCIDIHDRKTNQAERERLLRIIEESSDFIATADMNANIKFINPAGMRIVGLAENANYLALQIQDLHPAWASQRVLEQGIPTVLRQGVWQDENALLHCDGREIPVSQLLLAHRDETGQPVLLSTIMRDISDFKRTERTLKQARDQAESLARSKAEFLANMSHEIRTPMNAIIGLSQLALNTPLNSQQHDYLDKILGASEHLLGILNDILDFSKLEAERLAIVAEPFNLDELIHNLDSLFNTRAVEKSLEFSINAADDVPRLLLGDALRLRQILVNLIGNSFKFTERGFIRLNIVNAGQPAERSVVLGFVIEDSGIGISAEHQQLLFKPFAQADGSITRRFGGAGLGLVISRKLAQMMGSDIHCRSTLGAGSVFSFEMPFRLTEQSEGAQLANPRRKNPVNAGQLRLAARGLANVRVLLVEDNRLNRQVASEFLREAGLKVFTANDGLQAMDLLADHNFEVVLMDIQMPVLDGLQATRQIRNQARFADLPIIAMSAGVTLDEQAQCQAAGMTDFISKPIDPLLMIEKLRKQLGYPATPAPAPGADAPAADREPPDLPGFDPERLQLLEVLLGDWGKVMQSLLQFGDEYQHIEGQINDYLAGSQNQAACELLHGLKGSAANLGANRLAETADALESSLSLGLQGNGELRQFLVAWQAVARTLQTLAYNTLPAGPTGPTGPPASSGESLARLQSLLADDRLVPVELLNALSARLTGPREKTFARLRKAIAGYDYQKALEILKDLQ